MGIFSNNTPEELATNSHFSLKSLLVDRKGIHQLDTQSKNGKAAMHFIRHGTLPENEHDSDNNTEPNNNIQNNNIQEGGIQVRNSLREGLGYYSPLYEADEADDKPAWYNPLTLAGRAVGYVGKRFDQGFSKSYKGIRHRGQLGYGSINKQHIVAKEAAEDSSMYLGAGLGKAFDTGNYLYKVGINQYRDSDASFVGDGEESATSSWNIPAIIAAKMAGGRPHPETLRNGINGRASSRPFKLKPLRDDFGVNG